MHLHEVFCLHRYKYEKPDVSIHKKKRKYGFLNCFALLYPTVTRKEEVEQKFDTLDWRILNWIRRKLKCPFLDFLMPKITMLGSAGMIWLIAAAALLCTKRYRTDGVLILAGLTLASFVGQFLLKHIIRRQRPCKVNEGVELIVKHPKDTSFPSCHTLTSVVSATILASASPVFGSIAIPIAALIAFSRLYLYVHYPSDVISATAIGVVLGEVVFRVAAAMQFSI